MNREPKNIHEYSELSIVTFTILKNMGFNIIALSVRESLNTVSSNNFKLIFKIGNIFIWLKTKKFTHSAPGERLQNACSCIYRGFEDIITNIFPIQLKGEF
jgi:hypothetical protein